MLNPFQKKKLSFMRNSFPYKKKTFSKPPQIDIWAVYNQEVNGLNPPTGIKGQVTCFYHDDDKPSMTLYYKSNTFFCFTCRKWGSAYQIIMDKQGLTFPEAIAYGERNYRDYLRTDY